MVYQTNVPDGQILDMKDARVETALEMELLMERVPESIRFSKVSNFVISAWSTLRQSDCVQNLFRELIK